MKISFACVVALLAFQVCAQVPLPSEVEDPQCLGINKEPAHASLMPYANQAQALAAKRYDSSFCQSLNGMWKFNWVREPGLRPADFYKTDFDASSWKEIPVPSNWQILGYGTPFYRNLGYTFQRDWPHVLSTPPTNYTSYVERDPVGSYRREFEVPSSWGGRQVFIAFDGVDSAFFLWINGQKVGYSVNSRNKAEFNVTKYLKSGKNLLAAEVYTYSAGSYIEDQDMWRLSGIFRNVSLWSAPQVHIRDFFVETDLDGKYQNATESVTAKIQNYSAKAVENGFLKVEVFDSDGRVIANSKTALPSIEASQEKAVNVTFPVPNPAKWSAETPNLYTTVLTLSVNGIENSEIMSARTGFRKIELKNRVFTINGVPVKLKGANRHENWPDTGHYVSEERMIRDLELLKQGNANHVRTCHYSDDPRWYELCDEYGIYLVAEANCECHGYGGVLDREPKYESAIVDRSVANVQNFKNHPSVVMWSLGNECGNGSNFVSALKAVKTIDASRPVHYEPFQRGKGNPADVDGGMYTNPDELTQIATNSTYTKPYYLCEYAHAMFNSMGELGGYNDVFDKYPSLMGGAIWEWEDQGIWNRRDTNRQFLAFGGGFGDFPNDHYFIHKGVIFSDRTPKPHYPEMKHVYQWVRMQGDDARAGVVKIYNKYSFLNLDQFAFQWDLSEDGTVIDHGALGSLALAPGNETEVVIPFKKITAKPGAEYYLRVFALLKKDQLWAKAGYEIASQQIKLPVNAPAKIATVSNMPTLRLEQTEKRIMITGSGFSVVFDKEQGTISELVCEGKNMLLAGGGPKLHLYRAPHQKDDMWAFNNWRTYGLSALRETAQDVSAVQTGPSEVHVSALTRVEGKNGFSVDRSTGFTVYGDGSIVVDNVLKPHGRRIVLPRIGVRMQLDKQFDQFAYLGRGPMENYSDRKRGSDIGLYRSSVKEQMTPYAKPMECGNHEDVCWASLSGKNLPALMVQSGESPLQLSALPFTDEVMAPVEYSVDLPDSTSTVLTIAARTLGVGSAGCGPRPREPYLVWSEPTSFTYVLRLLPNAQSNLAGIGRMAPPKNRVKPALLPATASRPRLQGRIVSASSFEPREGNPENAIDGNTETFWHSRWSSNEAKPPHFLVIDYGREVNISEVQYTARGDGNNGHVRDYEVYLSPDGREWGRPAAKGSFDRDAEAETVHLKQPTKARFMKFVALSEQDGRAFATVAELEAIETNRDSIQEKMAANNQ